MLSIKPGDTNLVFDVKQFITLEVNEHLNDEVHTRVIAEVLKHTKSAGTTSEGSEADGG